MVKDYFHFNEVFDHYHYPTGEIHVEMKPVAIPRSSVVETHCRNAEDLFMVRMASNIAPHLTFFIPYLPFARHDHRRHAQDGFPVDVVNTLLDGVNIIIADPHSDVVGTRYKNIKQNDIVDFLRKKSAPLPNPVFLIPDAGATKKAYTWLRETDDRIQAVKTRDRATGKLSGFDYLRSGVPADISSRTVIIVDDICDGGGTFVGLANKFCEEYNPARIELWITHGMFQCGKMEALLNRFDRIQTFFNDGNNHMVVDDSKLHLFEFKELIEEL